MIETNDEKGQEENFRKEHEKIWGLMDMFIVLIVVKFS